MPTITLKHGAGLTHEQSEACFRDGQRRWWIASVSGTKAKHIDGNPKLAKRFDAGNIVKYVETFGPATYPLHCTTNLDFGLYVLGCGTGSAAFRKFFRVDLMGVRWL